MTWLGIGNVVRALGVSRMVLGGGVVRAWEFIAAPLRETFGRTMAGRLLHASVVAGAPEGGINRAVEIAADEYLKRLALAKRAH